MFVHIKLINLAISPIPAYIAVWMRLAPIYVYA